MPPSLWPWLGEARFSSGELWAASGQLVTMSVLNLDWAVLQPQQEILPEGVSGGLSGACEGRSYPAPFRDPRRSSPAPGASS
jgi:hypothetical protein